jgi:5-(carboxyamino)imidazole ribonucleotide synthase
MDARTGLPVVGMIGGGQLARMTHQAAIALGQSLRVLAVSADDGAAMVAADVRIGHHTDLAALREFAKGCDVVTFDHEHVPGEHIAALAAEGIRVAPSASALRYAQDKQAMRERLSDLGFPVPRWRAVAGPDDVAAFAAEVGWPVVVKAVRGGYDGRGVWVAGDLAQLQGDDGPPRLRPEARSPGGQQDGGEQDGGEQAGGQQDGGQLIVEERVVLRRELAAVVARSPFGQVAVYPIVETVQRAGICVEVIAPAQDLAPERAAQAQRLAVDLATRLDVVGILAVELFETDTGLLVNELAMRPHNSGHWTIEGARTSQFEQHLRAVLDYPLGETGLTAPVVVMANVLGGAPGGMSIDERLHHLFAADPGIRVHLYGKQPLPGRKIGHVTALGDDVGTVRARAVRAARWLREGHDD